MSTEEEPSKALAAKDANAWRRFLAWLAALEEAMDFTYDDLQDQRILRLEREVADLKAWLDSISGDHDGPTDGAASALH
jgi:hypothetical protein